MRWWGVVVTRLRGLVRREAIIRDIDEELRLHVELEAEEHINRGMEPDEARRAAVRSFGDVGRIKDLAYEVRGGGVLETLWQDVRYGARSMIKNPSFFLVSVLTLALGIGANTAIFSVVNAVLLRPLPYPQSERIMAVGRDFPGVNQVGGTVDDRRFLFWREHNESFEAMSAHQAMGSGVNLSGGAEAEFVPALRVSVDFFRMLGIAPVLGRGFTAEEDRAGGERVVILSDGLWRRRFAADAGLLGQTVSLNDINYTVVGIMPPGSRFTQAADVFVPLRPGPESGNTGLNFTVLARLKEGVSREQALIEMNAIADRLRSANPKLMGSETINVTPYRDALTSPATRSLLWILLGAVGFVLLIACANVANLQLTRASSRYREIAVRNALGASRVRIVRQLLTEGLLLAAAGAALGTLVAVWATALLRTLIPEGLIPRAEEIGFDWRVLAFTAAAATATGIIFSLAPAISSAQVDVNQALKEGAGRGVAGAGRNRLRGALAVTEIALALVLLVGAMLLFRTFSNLRRVAPGFDSQNVLTFQVTLGGARYGSTASVTDFQRGAAERLKSLPGVLGVATTNVLPLDSQYNMPFELSSRPGLIDSVQYRTITPDYFGVMKMDLRRGRSFTEGDTATSQGVVTANEAFVRRYLSDAEPLGQQVFIGRMIKFSEMPFQIVGIVSDAKQFDLRSDAPPALFVPAAQHPNAFSRGARTLRFVVRTAGEPLGLSARVKDIMRDLDASLPVTGLRSIEQIVSRSVAQERFNMQLIAVFAGLGLTLAAVGVYGVMSYAVLQRTNEMGVRLALGAQTGDIFRLVLKQGAALALVGVAAGLAGALALTRMIRSMLYGVSATDPLTFIMISASLMVVALVACYIPARRAAKVDPLVALRYE